jgi:hypothetical protein
MWTLTAHDALDHDRGRMGDERAGPDSEPLAAATPEKQCAAGSDRDPASAVLTEMR